MSEEQVFLTKWQNLSQDQQKQVLDFMDFLYWQQSKNQTTPQERLQQIRNLITSYRIP
ncbi:unknown protein [Nostoc sp. NIES-3756]|jgi:hypothetical protein|uniref:hypothetical protein n=1 Tax=Nostoc sp. NIES-3756 TaxID=1751286 RepID=UPI000721C7F9|nr:hypothetical protein [Nostoc sp. NIES-3756]BAT53800.1 unknown protein [Nostoc sp. NIES-3756]BAY38465.1 hypothetical protein NIES2111_28120 [Nostoc sp. NIES-2111]